MTFEDASGVSRRYNAAEAIGGGAALGTIIGAIAGGRQGRGRLASWSVR